MPSVPGITVPGTIAMSWLGIGMPVVPITTVGSPHTGSARFASFDLGALRGVDRVASSVHSRVDALLGQQDVTHLDRLGVMRDHLLGEQDIGLIVGVLPAVPVTPAAGWRSAVACSVLGLPQAISVTSAAKPAAPSLK